MHCSSLLACHSAIYRLICPRACCYVLLNVCNFHTLALSGFDGCVGTNAMYTRALKQSIVMQGIEKTIWMVFYWALDCWFCWIEIGCNRTTPFQPQHAHRIFSTTSLPWKNSSHCFKLGGYATHMLRATIGFARVMLTTNSNRLWPQL